MEPISALFIEGYLLDLLVKHSTTDSMQQWLDLLLAMLLQLQPRQHNSLDDSNSSSIVNNHILDKQLPLKRLVEHLRLDLLSSLQLFVQ